MMVSNDATKTSFLIQACGHLAPLASVVVFMAPIPTFRQIRETKTVGNLPLLPYSSMVASCLVWLTYGVLIREPKVWSSNGIGLVLGLAYFQEFVKYLPKKLTTTTSSLPGTVMQHVQGCVMILLLNLTLVILYSKATAARYIGSLGVVLCLAMFASPLIALKVVLDTKSAKPIPLPFTMATVANCLLWSVLGWFEMSDFNIYAPNLLGLSFGLAQIGLKLRFGNGDGNGNGSSAVELPL